MYSFFINIMLLLRTLVYGFRNDAEFRTLIFLMITLLIGGTLIYWQALSWTILDSFYFCVMPISTIGYGDFAPTTPFSKGFTIVYAIMGIGLFASFVGKLVALRMEHHAKSSEKRRHKSNH
jgi:voltage-gated potassium channel